MTGLFSTNDSFHKEERRAAMVDRSPKSVWNGKIVMADQPSLMIESDASTGGWRATCKGTHTGGPLSPEESQWHVNCLEVLTAFHAVKYFVRDRNSITVLLLLNTTIAVANRGEGDGVSSRLNYIVQELHVVA